MQLIVSGGVGDFENKDMCKSTHQEYAGAKSVYQDGNQSPEQHHAAAAAKEQRSEACS